MTGRPLEGWRVLELADGVAAAFAGKVLADLGAEVVVVEPPHGHPLRAAAPCRDDGLSARFLYLNTGKRSVVVRPGAEGDRRVRDLAAQSDLVITDWDATHSDHLLTGAAPVVRVRPFGSSGPRANRRARHLTQFHSCGESSTLPSGRGWELFPDRAPLQLGSEIGYFDAGWNAALVALAACYDSLRGTPAQQVEVSIQESLLTLNRTRLSRFSNDGVCVGREKNRYGITGMLQCADGWVQVVGLREEHWDRLVALPDGAEFEAAGFASAQEREADTPRLGELLASWCAGRTKADVARIMSGLGAPAGAFAEAADLLTSSQLAHRGFLQEVDDGRGGTVLLPGAPYRFSGASVTSDPAPALGADEGFSARQARPPASDLGPGRLLEGVQILDFTWAAAGPYATLLLGFLGAEVIKVESTRRPDPARGGFLTRYDGINRSPIFNELNLNKRSFQLDLTQPEGIAIAKQLAGRADVVVENFRPGVLARLGLPADELGAANPRLIVAASSANGATGPDAMGAGLASIFAATGGLSMQTGYEDGPPTEVGDPVDYRSGAALAVAVLAALLDRARTGLGQYIDLSSREVVIASAPDALLAHSVGVPWNPRVGNGHRDMFPHDVYGCSDGGWLALAVGDQVEWSALCRVLGHDEWTSRFPSAAARREAADEIGAAIRAWTAVQVARDAAELLQAAGVPAEAVLSFEALAADEHLAARQTFLEVAHPELGRQRVMRAPWLFSNGVTDVRRPGPLLGADNDDILAGIDALAPISAQRANEVFR